MSGTSNSGFSKYLLFGGLYFPEGLIIIVTTVILPLYFYEKGISPEIITLVIGITLIPMIIKFIWGGIADYFIRFGRRRFIIFGGILSGISILLLTTVDPHIALIPFAFLFFISWCGMGFLSASSDALAIDVTQKEERGKINGAIYAGQNGGMIAGSLLLPFIAQRFGYIAVFLIAGLIIILMSLLPLLIKETKRDEKQGKVTALLINEFKKKNVQQLAIFTPILMISSGILMFLAPLYMKDFLHLDLTQIGLIGGVFTIGTAVGSVVGGALADRWGRKITLSVFIATSIFFTTSLIFTNNWQNFAFVYGGIGFLQGGYFAALLATLMDATNPRIGATQFSMFTSLLNLGNVGASAASGALLVLLGFNCVFLYSAWVFGPAMLLLYFIKLKA